MEIISRRQAQGLGLPTYFTGKPCKHGHLSPRYSRNKDCLACKVDWRERHPTYHRDRAREYYKRNPAKAQKKQFQYRQRNPDRWREIKRTSRQKDPAAQIAYIAVRRARQMMATPPWLSDHDLSKMREVYRLAREESQRTGIKHHVDHIVPLGGDKACGLHVPWNLQVISAASNLRKSNKVEGT